MTALLLDVDLRDGVGAWFTGRDLQAPAPPLGEAGNLSHRRPHRPGDLARDRGAVGEATGTDVDRWHLMQQVHGAEVAVVDADTPSGAQLPGVDAAVTVEVDRALVVQVADCVPVLVAGRRALGVAHAGRRGVQNHVVGHMIERMRGLGEDAADLVAAIGPAIGGCCYEVPAALVEEVAADHPVAAGETTWGTPSLDLPAAVARELAECGVAEVSRHGGCTLEDERWFSHRRSASAGRQVGLITRRSAR